jgi:DtxR family transcriptional regulator, Mn-dependent transcriptional regulator
VTSKISPPANSESVDDYLKAILELGGAEEDRVSSNAIAERLGVRAASVTGMIQKLASHRPPLVLYEKHRGVRLTTAGKRRGWELVRHHRLLELFLHNVLRYSWDEVHEEAERLEHFISERFEDRVAALLGDPEIDPHGHVIPRKNTTGLFAQEVLLSQWKLGARAMVSSVSDRDADVLRELERLKLKPGMILVIRERNPNVSVTIQFAGATEQVRVSYELAESVSVTAASAQISARQR